jgi:hypothetical protein
LKRTTPSRFLQEKVSDFNSRESFAAFGRVTFVAWTSRLPDPEKPAFVSELLDR